MNYKFYTGPKNVPITSPLPAQKMVENLAGGYAYEADLLTQVRRWLLTGGDKNTFYQTKEEQTVKNVEFLQKAITYHADEVAKEIIYASNYGINNHTPILALVLLSIGSPAKFREIFNTVIRTASHLYEFVEYVKDLRGFGKTIHKAVAGWIASKNPSDLEFQFLKYQERNGWSVRDVLRKFKPTTIDELVNKIFAYFTGHETDLNGLPRITAYEAMKKGDIFGGAVVDVISSLNMGHEMIPANVERTPEVWEALFKTMPINALVRNLGNLTNKGIFVKKENLILLEQKFSPEAIKRGRVHPIVLCSALLTYTNPNTGYRKSSLTWTPVPMIGDVLEKAIEVAFDSIEPTNKTFYHAIDVSSSMTRWSTSDRDGNPPYPIAPSEIAAIMALATIKSEKFYYTAGFSSRSCDFDGIRKNTSFKNIVERNYFDGVPAGLRGQGTNLGSAIQHAIDKNIKADVLVFWTDGQSWQGNHPSVLLDEYRRKINKDAKAIYVILGAYSDKTTLAKPTDKNAFDIAGFSSETVKLIQMITDNKL